MEPKSEIAREIVDTAKVQSYEYQKGLISKDELISAEQFCELLGFTPTQLNQAVINQAVMKFDIDGQSFYPSFYANCSDDVRRDIERISIDLGELSAAQKWMFFTRPKGSLGGITPIEALANGQYENVLIAAKGFRER